MPRHVVDARPSGRGIAADDEQAPSRSRPSAPARPTRPRRPSPGPARSAARHRLRPARRAAAPPAHPTQARRPAPTARSPAAKPANSGNSDPGRVAERLHQGAGDERGATAEAVRERPGGDLGNDPDRGPEREQRRDLRIGQARVREQQGVERVDRHQVGQQRPPDDAPGERAGRERESTSTERHGPTVARTTIDFRSTGSVGAPVYRRRHEPRHTEPAPRHPHLDRPRHP